VNIGNRTLVKSGDILDIEHRTAIYMAPIPIQPVGVTLRDNSACLLMLGSANSNYCSTLGGATGEACMLGAAGI